MTTQTKIPVEQHQPKMDSGHGLEPVRSNHPERPKKKSGLLKFFLFVLVPSATGGPTPRCRPSASP